MPVNDTMRQNAAVLAAARCAAVGATTPLDYIVEYQSFLALLDYFGDGGDARIQMPQKVDDPQKLPAEVQFAAFRRTLGQ